MRRSSNIERSFAILSLLLFGGAILPLFRNATVGETANTDGDIISHFVFLTIYIITAYYSINHLKPLKAAITSSTGLLIIFSLAVLSIGWSDNPAITARRVFALCGSSLFGYYLAMRYSLNEILLLVNRTLFIATILSTITALVFPGIGLMNAMQEGGFNEGAWKGIYTHKNTLGRLMVINTLISFILYITTKQKKYWFEIALAIFLIVMSRSSSALVLVVLIIGFSYILKTFRLRGSSLTLMLLGVLTFVVYGGIYLSTNYDVLFDLLGKDPTLTGRTLLWEQVILAISNRPFLGHGFNGFWLKDNSASSIISQELNWEVPNAHNGFLDVTLDLGCVGIIAFMALYIINLFSFMKSYSLHRQQVYEWGIMYFVLFFVYNIVESSALRQNSFWWIIFVATISSYSLQNIIRKRNIKKPVPIESIPIISTDHSLSPVML